MQRSPIRQSQPLLRRRQLFRPECRQLLPIPKNRRGLPGVRQTHMPLRRVARRRQRQHIRLIIQHHRIQKPVHPPHQFHISLLGHLAKLLQKLPVLLRRRHRRKSHPHMIRNPRLTRRGHLQLRKFRHKNPRLQPDKPLQVQQIPRRHKLLQPVQHIKIHNPRHPQARLSRQPGKLARRIPIRIIRKKRMPVQIDIRPRRRQLNLPLLHLTPQLLQGLTPLPRLKTIQHLFPLHHLRIFTSCCLLHRYHRNFLYCSSQRVVSAG
ncbi:MAG: hypothetical protein BWY71_01230 [Planctomycetes bacterium ADurb.Bin412]|nr:MAG: hypothetical protein BWY71_01230 [Planctomycetes bacterium ADurb.Bin412]